MKNTVVSGRKKGITFSCTICSYPVCKNIVTQHLVVYNPDTVDFPAYFVFFDVPIENKL